MWTAPEAKSLFLMKEKWRWSRLAPEKNRNLRPARKPPLYAAWDESLRNPYTGLKVNEKDFGDLTSGVIFFARIGKRDRRPNASSAGENLCRKENSDEKASLS
jgi:hypothetical protein